MQDAVNALRMTHIVAEALHKSAVFLCAGFRLPVPVRVESVHCDAARCQCAEVCSGSACNGHIMDMPLTVSVTSICLQASVRSVRAEQCMHACSGVSWIRV